MSMGFAIGLDLELLRSFVAIAEEKCFTRAADRVGRTQSAISLQMRRLKAAQRKLLLNRGKGGSFLDNWRACAFYLRGRRYFAATSSPICLPIAVPTSVDLR